MYIAIPCNSPGGLEALVSNHFGECDLFTVVDIDPKTPDINESNVQLIDNPDHLNCGMVILRLKKVGAEAIILNKIGRTALEILQKENIPLYAGHGIVQDVLKQFTANQLQEVSDANICAGKE